jgi:hypothetical protein
MTRSHTLTEKLALSILAREGVAAIEQLRMAADDAHQTGHPAAAAAMLEIAEAAEAAWLRAEGVPLSRRARIPNVTAPLLLIAAAS